MSGSALSLRAFNALFPDEDSARAWFERARWPHGPECPSCGSVNRARWIGTRRKWACRECDGQFTVTAGTPMHRTRVPLLSWLQAIYLIVASSKGISAVKLGEMLGVSYPTAWFMGHRIRVMMTEANPILTGVIEVDEMYAGAPPRKRAKPSRDHEDDPPPPPNTKGRGTKRPLVLVAAERGGDVVAKVIPTHGKEAIASALDGVLDPHPVQVGRPRTAARHHVHRGQPGIQQPDLQCLRLRGRPKSPLAGQVLLPVVRPHQARRSQCGAEHRGAPCAPYRFGVPEEGGSPWASGGGFHGPPSHV